MDTQSVIKLKKNFEEDVCEGYLQKWYSNDNTFIKVNI